MRTVRLTIAYDGADFFGWQFQTGMRTVQQTMSEAIRAASGEDVTMVSAGRTDTGVHALAQVVSFVTQSALTNASWHRALNHYLPPDVTVLEVADAPDSFHAIVDSRGKRYRYLIHDGPKRDVFARSYAWRIWQSLDVAAMHGAGQGLVGTHDFAAYQNAGSSRQSTVRTVREVLVERRRVGDSDRVVVEVEADGFLYNMVRNIVGTLVEVGKHKRPVDWPAAVLAGRDRRQAGMCAPAHGLYLLHVFYD